ncbi:YjjG family noncanonical pyrimidine nucleotidase [Neolewinella lacunae]|uniref:Noncanonical pyrimidine nucleotidase, YjjG family n=1 Tax=Neolewinella lacunae TaxID=1517758 RepID=A0A923PP37_9BACT|nr:YjjG family noncanonical pyrimidine nucleotidase [Neolewinella lacunae]MBC6995990.1 noncanonical pyrimidine nucleotidase, YjjG family [Neolewinella lacunae]MDN3633164.1 YjjG family noncanonical pyrimidine nucleotidase [Neolewinella lacunae]
MYRWLLFDADNTLWDFDAAEASALERTLRERDIDWSDEVLGEYREINHRAWADYERGLLPKEQLRTIRFERLLERYQLDHPAEELSFNYRTYLSQSTHLLEGAYELLTTLRPHYRLGMVTNGLREVQRSRLLNTGLDHFFEFVAISDEIGVGKPQAAFFDYAYAQMDGVDKSAVLVIGDNPVADVRGALDYGFHACWLRHPGVADQKHLGETYRIRDIRDLTQLLVF